MKGVKGGWKNQFQHDYPLQESQENNRDSKKWSVREMGFYHCYIWSKVVDKLAINVLKLNKNDMTMLHLLLLFNITCEVLN